MPLKLVDLQRDQRTLQIDITVGEGDDGLPIVEPLVVTYRPSSYTGRTEKELNELMKGDWKSLFGMEFVRKLLISWDLEAEDGTPYPLTEDALSDLPTPFIGEVITAVSKDLGKVRQP